LNSAYLRGFARVEVRSAAKRKPKLKVIFEPEQFIIMAIFGFFFFLAITIRTVKRGPIHNKLKYSGHWKRNLKFDYRAICEAPKAQINIT